ncbi:hypothetical protein [Ruminococcus sp.]|jgi:hypothetical protein|uniref:hypothetical protein n=1 Tax=Ruminococcus sp. TaxID=41978 RepID=UPI0025D7EEF9|nr:hypothetical protein [Ruminococcus sp.]
MSEKKTTEMNELLDEAKDMELGDETGASAGAAIAISVAITAGAYVAATKAYRCGAVMTVSAECNGSRKSCR